MRLNFSNALSNLKTIEDLTRYTSAFASEVGQIVNSNLTFNDNFLAVTLSFVFTASSTTVGIQHGLGKIPSGYIVIGTDAAMSVFDGNQENTASTIFLQASAAGTARVLVLG